MKLEIKKLRGEEDFFFFRKRERGEREVRWSPQPDYYYFFKYGISVKIFGN